MENKKFTFADRLGLMILLFLTLSAVFPAITTFGNNAIFCLTCQIMWLAITYYDNRDNFSALFSKYSWWIVMLIYLFVVPRMFENITISNRYTPYFIGVFGTMMFEYYYQNNKMHVIERTVKIAMPFYFFTLIRTIIAAIENPWIARSIKNSDDEFNALLRQGIGNYNFVYMSVLIFTIAMIIFLFSNKTKPRIVSLITMLLCLMLFSYTNYFTALIISIISAAIILTLYIGYCVKNSEKIKVLELFVLLFVFLIAIIGSDSISSSLSNFIGDETTRIGRVINSGGDSTISSIADEFLRDRFPTMMRSLDIFVENPFLGVSVLTRGVPSGLGQHSSILDTFALHGIFIGFAFFKMHGLPYKKYDFYQNNVEYRRPLYLALFGISFFNNLTHSLLMASTIICPYLIYRLQNKKNSEEG